MTSPQTFICQCESIQNFCLYTPRKVAQEILTGNDQLIMSQKLKEVANQQVMQYQLQKQQFNEMDPVRHISRVNKTNNNKIIGN